MDPILFVPLKSFPIKHDILVRHYQANCYSRGRVIIAVVVERFKDRFTVRELAVSKLVSLNR